LGTFMTVGGDYGYLAGSFVDSQLRLSCFDGSHAFLFEAKMADDGTLSGDFWSGTKWHETWTARRDDKATLPDGFVLTGATAPARFEELVFPDLEGKPRSLAEITAGAKVVIVEVFGTWCPNCHDAARYLVEVDRRYRDRGVRVVGLAFELSGDLAKDAGLVKRFAERYSIESPLLIGGQRGKDKVEDVLPVIDKLRAYPTTIIMDGAGNVRAVHTGFSGPATGEEYDHLRAEFERVIEGVLAEGGRSKPAPGLR
jgi:thiol-disulfide isomerase/thioredoxin